MATTAEVRRRPPKLVPPCHRGDARRLTNQGWAHRQDYHDFWTCPDCGRIFWQGSHYDRLVALVEDIRRAQHDAGSL